MQTVVERIQAFNQGKDVQLLHRKYEAMREDVFAFFRGTCHLFYEDWPAISPLNDAPVVWICGDAHTQNFGTYKADNRLAYFNVNDFDEAVLAPCTWDLARFLTGLFLNASILAIDEEEMKTLSHEFLQHYTRSFVHNQIKLLDLDTAHDQVKDLLMHVKERKRKDFLQKRTHMSPGGKRLLRLHEDQIDIERVTPETRAEIATLMERWGQQQPNPQFFTLLDVAHRIAGIGSLGVERYVLLVEGKGSPDQNYLLDLKEARPSSLSPYLNHPQPHWDSEAKRIVTVQSWFQEVPPALQSAIDWDRKSYVLRELQPQEDKIDLKKFKHKPQQLEELVQTMGEVLAAGHLRSSRVRGTASARELSAFAQTEHWQHAVLKYAQTYAVQVYDDYRSFRSDLLSAAFGERP
ncbi:MAG TPA: DUF2252 family protein [Ktedonobacteraceae bacterium]